DGLFITDYIAKNFPALLISGKSPANWMADTLNENIANMDVLNDIGKLKASKFANLDPNDVEAQYESFLGDSCMLIAAGANVDPVRAKSLFVEALKPPCISICISGNIPIAMTKWAPNMLNQIAGLETPTPKQIDLAAILIEAGVRVKDETLMRKITEVIETKKTNADRANDAPDGILNTGGLNSLVVGEKKATDDAAAVQL
ncbi:MAG: hypothetical protein ACHP6I_01985, partial [Rickettsiales bacterium]